MAVEFTHGRFYTWLLRCSERFEFSEFVFLGLTKKVAMPYCLLRSFIVEVLNGRFLIWVSATLPNDTVDSTRTANNDQNI